MKSLEFYTGLSRYESVTLSLLLQQSALAAKKALQEHLKLMTGLKFPDATGKGGTTTTGNVARRY